jgi:uncharacterized membrane protein
VVLTVAAALGSGLMAGTFFAFSTFVMASLDTVPAQSAVAAMSAMNRVIAGSAFMPVFMGTAFLCIVLLVVMLANRNTPASMLLLAGSVLFLIGTFGVTAMFNVPLNERLVTVSPESPNVLEAWKAYWVPWTFWNHVRTVAALASTLAFVLAVR